MTNSDPFRELVQAYALDSLDEQVRAEFEAHLAAGCGECAQELAEARWLVSELAHLAPTAAPSDALKARLMSTVQAEAQASASQAPPEVVSMPKTKSLVPWWLWVGVAAMLLLTVYSSWRARGLQQEMSDLKERAAREDRQRQALQHELLVAQHEAIILSDPKSVKIMMPPTSPNMPQLLAAWHSQWGLVVSGQKVPMPADDWVLQLWLIPKTPGGKPMPSMIIRPDSDGQFMMMVENPPAVIAEIKAIAITEEPAGGSHEPTTKPMWVGGIS